MDFLLVVQSICHGWDLLSDVLVDWNYMIAYNPPQTYIGIK